MVSPFEALLDRWKEPAAFAEDRRRSIPVADNRERWVGT